MNAGYVIPTDLIGLRRWVVWRSEQRNGTPTKVPYTAKTGRRASVRDARTWGSFSQAQAAAPKYDGLGFVLTGDDGFVGFDLDGCRDPQTGAISQEAQQIIDEVMSYTEVSPSGTGIRIFAKGTLPSGGRKRGGVEIYDSGRFLTVTGQHLPDTPSTVEERSEAIAVVHARVFGTAPHTAAHQGQEDGLPPRWLRLIQWSGTAKMLWEGRGETDDGSASAQDLKLAHYARRQGFTPVEVEIILRNLPYPLKTGLRTRDYVRRTVDRAFAGAGTRPRRQYPFGQFPAWIVTLGLLQRLSHRAVRVLVVLVVRAIRASSMIVRISIPRIASESGVSLRRVGPATDELVKWGVIRKARAVGGRWNFWVRTNSPCGHDVLEQNCRVCQRYQQGHPPDDLRDDDHPHGHQAGAAANDALSPGDRRTASGTAKGGMGVLGSPPSHDIEHISEQKCHVALLDIPEQNCRVEGAAKPSMRLDQELDARGGKKVFRILSPGRRVLIWQGTITEWLSWMPPDCLRDESRMAEWPRPAEIDVWPQERLAEIAR